LEQRWDTRVFCRLPSSVPCATLFEQQAGSELRDKMGSNAKVMITF